MRRRSPCGRALGLLALVLLLAAQPRLVCGLHCLFAQQAAPAGAAVGAAVGAAGGAAGGAPAHGAPADAPGPSGHAPPMAMALCHGGSVTARHTLAGGSLATAWLPATAVLPHAPASWALAVTVPTASPRSALLERPSPPPRG